MTDNNYNNEAIKTLLDIAGSRDYVLWLGSGLSLESEYKNWKDSINIIAERCGVEIFPIEQEPTADDLIDKAEKCKDTNPAEYYKSIFDLYSFPPKKIDFNLSLLSHFPFKAIVTTNFDPLVSTLFPVDVNAYPNLPSHKINSSSLASFYIHGFADSEKEPQQIEYVFSRSEFKWAYSTKRENAGEGESAEFLRQLLTHHDLLIIGAELEEPEFKNVFERVDKLIEELIKNGNIKNPPDTERYALLPSSKIGTLNQIDEEIIQKRHNEEDKRDIRFGKFRIKKILYARGHEENIFENLYYIIRETHKRLPQNNNQENL